MLPVQQASALDSCTGTRNRCRHSPSCTYTPSRLCPHSIRGTETCLESILPAVPRHFQGEGLPTPRHHHDSKTTLRPLRRTKFVQSCRRSRIPACPGTCSPAWPTRTQGTAHNQQTCTAAFLRAAWTRSRCRHGPASWHNANSTWTYTSRLPAYCTAWPQLVGAERVQAELFRRPLEDLDFRYLLSAARPAPPRLANCRLQTRSILPGSLWQSQTHCAAQNHHQCRCKSLCLRGKTARPPCISSHCRQRRS